MIKYWNHAWNTYMMKVRPDKFWHFIAFLFFTIALNMAQINGIQLARKFGIGNTEGVSTSGI